LGQQYHQSRQDHYVPFGVEIALQWALNAPFCSLKKGTLRFLMTGSFSKSGGPVLDEATFQKLLAAAYVLQEHHDSAQPGPLTENKSDTRDTDSDTSILAQIVETQHEIQANHLDLDGTTSLVMERIMKITGAQGAAIGILEDGMLRYRSARGVLMGQVGQSVRPEAALSASTLLHDMILRCSDASTDFRVNPEIAKRLSIASLISVPVLHNGKTGGTLELAFAKADAFHDQDVRTCQLMAGLVTETLTHTAEEEWRKGVAAERASMLEVLEKIKPQLARLAGGPDGHLTVSKDDSAITEGSLDEALCQQCGNQLARGEVFCGSCGTSRAPVPGMDLQSKWATLWNLKNASENGFPPPTPDNEIADSLVKPSSTATESGTAEPLPGDLSESLGLEPENNSLALSEKKSEPADVSDAQANVDDKLVSTPTKTGEARVWLHSIAVSPPAVQLRGFWQKAKSFARTHRGDLALGASLFLFLITIIWAVSADHSTTSADTGASTTANTSTAPKPKRKVVPAAPKLGFFDQLLVDLGLAEAPPAPSYGGNPNVPVWVDVHTALYYCPGADLYGKTPQGKIASQRDAQQDQFEPASRRVCE
jgi:GAF domain-containing protein